MIKITKSFAEANNRPELAGLLSHGDAYLLNNPHDDKWTLVEYIKPGFIALMVASLSDDTEEFHTTIISQGELQELVDFMELKSKNTAD